jgi:hypothetical protein
MKAPHFTSTAFFIWGGLLTWAAYFLFVYVFAAVACARRFAHLSVAGLPVVSLVTGIATVIALGITVALTRFATQRLAATSAFARFLALALGALAVICILWVALPSLVLHRSC